MPISDEIIELAPVKKTKSKLIIMFVAMGVLLALAATFLVLYLLKPSVEQNTSRIVGVETEQSALFQIKPDGDGEVASYASVGTDYTVYATVSAEGDASTGVNWAVEPYGAVTEVGKGLVEGTQNKYYFTFRPSPAFATDSPVTITARSLSDNDKRAQIKFYIIQQGTESIKFNDYWVSSSNTRTAITGNKLELPFYSTVANNKSYYISFEQFGKYDPTTDRYSPITVVDNNGVPTNKIEVKSSDDTILKVGSVNESSNPARFDFRMLKTGTVTLTVTANKFNDFAEPYTKELTVEVKSNEALGQIDSVFISDQPVTDEFYEKYWNKQNMIGRELSSTKLTLPLGTTYDNILSHVVIVPLSIQYDKEKGEKKDGWENSLNVTSTNTNAVTIGRTAGKTTVSARGLAHANECSIVVKDSTPNGIGAEASLKCNVIMQNNTGEVSVKSGDKTYSNSELIVEKKSIPTSPQLTSTMSVTYIFSNPPASLTETEISNLANKGYIDTAFKFNVEHPEYFTIKIGATTIDTTKTYNFSESMKFSKVNNRIQGTATFSITVDSDAVKGVYDVEFVKVGTKINGASDEFNKTNRSWSLPVSFAISTLAKSAEFVDQETALKLITDNGNRAGKFVAGEVIEVNKVYKGSASVYVQNLSKGSAFPFDLCDLVTPSDGVTKVASLSSNGNAFSRSYPLVFTGTANIDETKDQATVNINVTNSEGTLIAQFTIKVYVIDAVTSIACRDNSEITHVYTGQSMSFTTDAVRATKQFLGQSNSEYAYNDINLYYVINGTDYPFAGEWNQEHTSKTFKFKSEDKVFDDVLFTFNSGRLTLNKDLFEYCYKTQGVDVQLGRIKIEYLVRDDDWYVGNRPTCSRTHIFERKADSVKIFGDREYTNALKLNNADSTFEYKVNQLETGNLYASAVIRLSDGTDVVARKSLKGALVEDVYIDFALAKDLIGNITASDKCAAGGDYAYYGITFRAPSIGDDSTKPFKATVHGASGYALNVTVENFSRQIDTISLYADSLRSEPLNKLVFGAYNNAYNDANNSAYVKTVYVTVDYQAPGDSDTRFEAVEIVLPTYLLYSIDGINYFSGSTFKLEPPVSEVKDPSYKYEFKIYVKLDEDSYKVSNGGKLSVNESQTADDATNASKDIDVFVGTGVKNISYTYGGVDYTTDDNAVVDIAISLSSNTDNTDIGADIDLVYNTLVYQNGDTVNVYKNIAYDVDSLSIDIPTIDGLKIERRNNKSGVNISVDTDNVKVIKNAQFDISFTDTANYEDGGKTFKISFRVSVTMDIYALAPQVSAVVTTGADSGSQTANVTVIYNNGDAACVPEDSYKPDVEYRVVKKTGENTYVAYNDGIKLAENNTKIVVDNRLLSSIENGSQVYFLEVSYKQNGKNIVSYAPIVVTTDSVGVRLVGSGNIAVENGVADIVVSGASDSFKLIAELYDRGTLSAVSGNVDYALYSDPARTSVLDGAVATVNNGVINVLAPTSATGVLYFRASHTDTASGKTFSVDVDVRYTLTLASVTLDGLDVNTFNNDVITLYYADNANYTYLDLTDYIDISMAFGAQLPNSGITLAVSSDSTDHVAVDGKILRPRQTTSSAVSATITATYNGRSVYYEFSVVVKSIGDIVLSDNGTADIVADDKTNVVLSDVVSDAALVYNYTLENADSVKFDITEVSDDNKSISFKRDGFTQNSDYKVYTFTARVEYSIANGSAASMSGAGGKIVKTAEFKLTVVGNYTPEFEIRKDGIAISEDGSYTIDGSAYVLALTDHNAVATYSASANNDVLTIGAFDAAADSKAIVFNENKSGTTTVTVSAVLYGKTYKSEGKSYTFTYGDKHLDVDLENADGESVADKSTVTVDHTGSGVTFTYVIDTTSVGTTVALNDVQVVCGGDGVTVGSVTQRSQGVYQAVLTAVRQTTLSVYGTVKVNGTTYYAASYTLNLTASAPMFALNASADGILPLGTTNLSVTQTSGTFKGAHTVTRYDIVSGGTWAGVDATTGVLTAKNNIYADKSVTVRATVSVNSGAYAGNTYTVDKTIIIYGVDLPSVEWNVSDRTVEITDASGAEIDLKSLFTLSDVAHSGDGSPYSYADKVNYTYSVVDASTTLEAGDRSIGGNTLTIADTVNTKAGGYITLRVTANINSGINSGSNITSQSSITVIVKPRAHSVSGVEVIGKAGSYDVRAAVDLYTKNAVDGFVSDSDADAAIVNYTIRSNPSSVPITVNGSVITLGADYAGVAEVELDAEILITTGAYAGTTVTCGTKIVVNGFTVNNKSVAWSDASNAYERVDVSQWINDFVTSNSSTVKNINVVALQNGGYLTIIENGTAAPTLVVDKDANIHGQNSAAIITVGLTVELNNGKTFYCTGSINVAEVTPELEVSGTVSANNDTYEVIAGTSFIIAVSEKHGFDLEFVSCNADDEDKRDYISCVPNGSNIIVSASADISSLYTVSGVKAVYKVGGVDYDYTFDVTISPVSVSAFSITNNEEALLKRYGTVAVESVWTPSAGNDNTYGYTVAFTGNNALKSVTFEGYDEHGASIKALTTQTNNSSRSFTMQLYSGNSYYPTMQSYASFKLIFEFNASASAGNYNVPVTYRSGNSSNSRNLVSTAQTYTVSISDSVSIRFVGNGGTFSENGGSNEFDMAVTSYGTISAPDAERRGYELVGWYRDRALNDEFDFGSEHIDRSFTLYAKWTAKQYEIVLDSMSSEFDRITVTYGSTYSALIGKEPTVQGYTFRGWYTQSNGRGTHITSGTLVTAQPELTLYAYFVADTYTVTFNANGGTLKYGENSMTVTHDGYYGMMPIAEKAGHTFVGWYTVSTQTGGTNITSSTKVDASADGRTLYARYTVNNYRITLDANGGTIAESYVAAEYDTYLKAALNGKTPTYGDNIFDGWFVNGIKVEDTDLRKVTGDMTAVARWSAPQPKFTVSFDANGGEFVGGNGVITVDNVNDGDTLNSVMSGANVSQPTYEGYDFDGWYINGVKVNDASKVVISGNTAVYARWKAVAQEPAPVYHKVTLNYQDKDDAPTSITLYVKDGETLASLSAIVPSKDGSTDEFVGWFDSASGGNEYTADSVVDGDIVLYAQWAPIA